MGYARQLPQDKNNNPYQAPPPFTSYQSQGGVPIASSVVTLSPNTTVIDVTVFGGVSANAAIIGKWGVASVTGTNFDWIVQSGADKTFVVPVSVYGSSPSIAGANAMNGLYNAVSLKTATATLASVFTVEY